MSDGEHLATLLVVEDDPTTARVVQESLKKSLENVAVLVAANGQEGIEIARENRPDVVILDWMMPDFDGEYFLTEQSKDDAISSLPVLIHSVADQSQTSDAINRFPPVKAFVTKIMPPVDLIEIVRHFLALKIGGTLGEN